MIIILYNVSSERFFLNAGVKNNKYNKMIKKKKKKKKWEEFISLI